MAAAMTNDPAKTASAPETSPVPCSICRRRRVKCDKRLPGCARCENSSQPCPGYNRLRSFLDQGDVLRKKYSGDTISSRLSDSSTRASNRADATADCSPQPSTTDGPSDIPHFSSRALPAIALPHDGLGEVEGHSPVVGSASRSTPQNTSDVPGSLDTSSDADFDAAFFDIDPATYYADEMNCCGWIPNAPLISDGAGSQGPTLSWLGQISARNFSDSTPSHSAETPGLADTSSSALSRDSQQEADRETAHLIRYFSDQIGPCLDVFDIDKYFGHIVPIRANRSSLLTNLMAAITSKQFAKTRQGHATDKTPPPARMFLDRYQDDNTVSISEWFYKAASFYDKAIGQMVYMLQDLQTGTGELLCSSESMDRSASTRTDSDTHTPSRSSSRSKRRRKDRSKGSTNIMEDLLAAVSIFLLYESLDDRKVEMLGHMSGAQYLLSKNLPGPAVGDQGLYHISTLRSMATVQAWRATFWNVVRVDYVLSYFKQTSPRLDTDDCHLWKSAGLPLRRMNGTLMPESLCGAAATDDDNNDDSEDATPMTETTACRTLLWIVLKSLAFVASERTGARSASQEDAETWHLIRGYLEAWEASLPDTFEPFARLQDSRFTQPSTPVHPDVASIASDGAITIRAPTLMYTSFMASTTMSLYHLINIVLLLHKPLDPRSSERLSRFTSRRLETYRCASREIDEHARKICGICVGQPKEPAQMHIAQPLHLAGLCAESDEQRFTIDGLLSGIQRTTGYSTEWIATDVREEWGWSRIAG